MSRPRYHVRAAKSTRTIIYVPDKLDTFGILNAHSQKADLALELPNLIRVHALACLQSPDVVDSCKVEHDDLELLLSSWPNAPLRCASTKYCSHYISCIVMFTFRIFSYSFIQHLPCERAGAAPYSPLPITHLCLMLLLCSTSLNRRCSRATALEALRIPSGVSDR